MIPQFSDVIASLPLDHCATEKNDLLCDYESFGETEYVAPPDYGFQMTGKFAIWSECSNIEHFHAPYYSKEQFIEEHKDEINKLQSEGMAPDKAFESFLEEHNEWDAPADNPYEPIESFIGGRLAIRGDDSGWTIVVKGPVGAGACSGVKTIQLPSGNGCERRMGFTVPNRVFFWRREVAEGIFKECGIEMVTYDEPEPELWLPKEKGTLWKTGDNPYPDLIDEFGEFGGVFMAAMIEREIRLEDIGPERPKETDLPF
jgi:hypothetical protein